MSEWLVDGVEADLDAFHLGPVDLSLKSGQAVAVLGSSGAGKTTFLRTLAGFLPLEGGRLLRDGEDISRFLPEERALGYVPQGLGLFPQRTVFGNVRYPMELRGRLDANARTEELLERFDLSDLKKRHPARLSGGEQQRVALARALAAEPELIVWDEPWQALDVEARRELGLVLTELREDEGIPVVVVTHDPGLAFSVADSFIVLDRGQVRLSGDAHDLLDRPSDPFVARFVGYENVYERSTLEAGRDHPFTAFLLAAAGPEGVALGTPEAVPTMGVPSRWEGVVRSARPNPEGVRVELAVDDLLVALRLPRSWPAKLPTVGDRLRFNVEQASVHRLGHGPGGAR
ncbi:MAG TPA: ABC transporter ATP-binding protein [Thermoplasmata archaeon]|nr:ABC transporter ATP-binding protein [Thermoplasmata archaeon]